MRWDALKTSGTCNNSLQPAIRCRGRQHEHKFTYSTWMAPHKCNCILRADMAPQHLIFVVLVGKVSSLADNVFGVVPGVFIRRGDVRFPCVTP
jgi:hypothetical protein